jgi:hypothetical protein
MGYLVDLVVYRLAGLLWTVIYFGLCRPAKRPSTLALHAFAPPIPVRIDRQTVAA